MLKARRLLKNRPRRLKNWSPNHIVPNGLTVMALCAGLTAIRFGLEGRVEFAAAAIIVAGVLDGLDGRAARLLKSTSRFGAELDSLSDFISFGVAPAVLIYQWSLVELRGFGWAVVLLYAVCTALRLARFNAEIDQPESERPPLSKSYFKGVPAPAGAGLALLPIMFWLQFDLDWMRSPWVATPVIVGVALLMISRLPTFSFKRVTIPNRYVLPILLLIGLMVAALVSAPWATLIGLGLLYLALVPVAAVLHPMQTRKEALSSGATATGDGASKLRGICTASTPPSATARARRGNSDA